MRNKATKENMNLDLRRYGKNLYTKAEESGEGGDSGELDYEAIYQFYRKAVLKIVPEEYLQIVVAPEHLEDVEWGMGSDHENNTPGIWKADNVSEGNNPLFYVVDEHLNIDSAIYFGSYINRTV